MNIKFGVTQWGLPGDGIYAVKLVREAGLDGLQLELGSYEKGYPLAQKRIQDAYMEDAIRYKIEFPSLVLNDLTINDFVHGCTCEKGEIAYEQIKIGIEAAARMKIKTVCIPNFFENFITEEYHFDNTVAALKYCCELAGEHDITIASESILNGQEHLRLLAKVHMPNLGILYDSMNYKFFRQYDQLKILNEVYPKMIRQLHVKDGTSTLSGSLLGDGNMDFFKQMEFLKAKNYSGWIIIENYYNQLPLRMRHGDDQLALLIKDLNTLKRHIYHS
ncbi:MAG: sugar phosphate isomerase/epimerase [Tannerellaceae bacterium]|jgi:sugar phosphate isomerase/epimerase|nr:sugar phosphate isomerase/epimerase [Tannerellaceae bacterium]